MSTATLTAELVPAGEGPDLSDMQKADSPALWDGYRAKLSGLKASIEAVIAADPDEPTSAKLARTNRLALRAIRIEIENKRKELGDYHLRKTQQINGAAKELKEAIAPLEEQLLAIEDHAERKAAAEKAERSAKRTGELSKYATLSQAIDYGALSDEEYTTMLDAAKALWQAKQAEAKRIEEERIAKEKAEAEERERIAKENRRLRAEAIAREQEIAAERKKQQEEARRQEEAAAAERKAAADKAAKELAEAQAKADAERKIAEQAAAVEREAKEQAERKLAKIRADEEKARKAAQAAERKLRNAPDKSKLEAFAKQIAAIQVPDMATEDGRIIAATIAEKIDAFAIWTVKQAQKLDEN
jgi:hypothetical protein